MMRYKIFSNSQNDQGASKVEYALLVALIMVFCVVAVKVTGGRDSGSAATSTGAVKNFRKMADAFDGGTNGCGNGHPGGTCDDGEFE